VPRVYTYRVYARRDYVMKKLLAFVLCIAVHALCAENGYKIVYDGGSLQDAKAGANMDS
jgi:hypothetical protein